MASGKIKPIIVDLKFITQLNISNRARSTVYHFMYTEGASNAPFTGGGHGYLYVNEAAEYGSQIVFSNQGVAWRALVGGTYGSWKYITS